VKHRCCLSFGSQFVPPNYATRCNNPAVYFPFLEGNADKIDHIRLLGSNIFGFEDLPNGGDKDFNDVIVKVNVSVV
jgi:hypothetical protein